NRLNDNDAVSITQILERNTTIKTLVLNHNEFREEGGVLLGEAIARNTTLEDIDLSWNHLRRCGAIGIARGLQENLALRTVNLAWNGFGFEGCLAIGDMLTSNHTITELDLACNRINPPALLELLRGLSVNRTLRILRIGYNPVTAAFSSLILAVIKKHAESGLENIDMAGVVVDKEFVALLEEIQKDRFFIVNYEVSLPVKKISREEMREKIGLPSAYNVDPLRMLYLLKEKMRASDFFYKINKDHDDGLQRDELYSLFDESGIPVTGSVVDKIFEFMDTNGDGTIDLGEFLQGDKRMKNIARKQVRDEQQRKGKDENYNRYSRTFQKAHLDPITNALKVDPTIAPMRQSRRPSVAPRDSSDTLDNNRLRLP
ncbi:hypothetical protein RRG08_020951, partial [Elysia crispata]